MRVGLIANTFENSIGAVAGGHVHFLEVAKRWPDFELYVFAPELARETIARELPRATFVPMPALDGTVPNKQIRYLFRTLLAIARRSKLRSCDVLLATSHFLPDLAPAMFAKRGRFCVCIQHVLDAPSVRAGAVIPNTITAIMQALSLALIRRFAPAVLLNDDATADAIGIDRHRTAVTLMTHGIEHLTHEGTEASTEPAHRPVPDVVYVGRLVPTKGVDDLIAAWSDIVGRFPGARLTIAGGGDAAYVAELEELARATNVGDSIDFTGRVSPAVKASLLAQARIFAFPSKEEGWGISIAEAMASGLPCVTYDLPAYRHVFTRGRVSVSLGDRRAFARAIIELFTDEPRRRSLSDEARSLARTFSWETAAAIEGRALRELRAQS